MRDEYVVLYMEGINTPLPLGAIKKDGAEQVMNKLKAETGRNYWAKPITAEEAERIEKDLTEKMIEGTERLLSDIKKLKNKLS